MAAQPNPNSPPNPPKAAAATSPSSPPWSSIVKDNVAEPSDTNAKKPVAWLKKPNGGGGGGGGGEVAVTGGVMGDGVWPSLADCTKPSPKLSSSSDSSIPVPDLGSTLSPQASGINTLSSTNASLAARAPSSISQKPTSSNSNHHMNSNHARPARQKSFKRDGGGGNPQANGTLSHQSFQPAGDGAHHQHGHASHKPNSGRSSENSGTDNVQNHNHRDSGHRNASGEHSYHQRNPFRKGNGGPHPRGDGSHQNYGGRRSDNHDFSHQRSFNGRDGSMQPRGAPRALVGAPPVAPPFVYAQPPGPPFLNPTVFFHHPGMPIVPPFPPVYFPVPGPELYSELMKQINYYFSVENLVRDTYLREHMDENGWVPVDVIAKFNRVKYLTTDTYQILEAIRPSTTVEIQGDKIRKRDDWKRWVIPSSVQFPASSGSQSPKGPFVSAIADHIQSVSLDDKINHRSNAKDQVVSAATLQLSVDSKNASPSAS